MVRIPNNTMANNDEFLKIWDYEKNSISPDKVSAIIQTKYWWTCGDCKNSYEESPKSKTKYNRGCLICANLYLVEGVNDYSIQYPDFMEEYSALNLYPYSSIKLNKSMLLLWWCERGHLYESSLLSRTGNRGCQYCVNKRILSGFNDVYTRFIHLMPYWDYELNEINPKHIFTGHGDFYWRCKNNHSWKSRITPSLEKEFYCSYCWGRIPMRNETDLATTMPDSIKVWDYEKNYPKTPQDFKKYSHAKVWWLCEDKKHSYERAISKWSDSPNCPKCHGNSSKAEKDFGKFLSKFYKGEIVTNSKKIIAPYELDFYLTEENLAIEFNGDYWHSDEVLLRNKGMNAKTYHNLKKNLCEGKGIKLLFVWESDWDKNKKNILKDLKNLLKNNGSIPKIFERLE